MRGHWTRFAEYRTELEIRNSFRLALRRMYG